MLWLYGVRTRRSILGSYLSVSRSLCPLCNILSCDGTHPLPDPAAVQDWNSRPSHPQLALVDGPATQDVAEASSAQGLRRQRDDACVLVSLYMGYKS